MTTPYAAALSLTLTPRVVHFLIAPTPDETHRTLHVFGHREDRADAVALLWQEARHQFDVVHHWRPWYRIPLWDLTKPVTPLPRVKSTLLVKAICLTVIGLSMFALGWCAWLRAVA